MVKESAPAVVEEMMSSLSLGEIQKVLQNLVRESIPIRDLVSIFESLADFGKISRSVDFLTERVRESLARIITLRVQGENGVVTVGTLSPKWEDIVKKSVQGDIMQGWQLAMDPREVQRFIASVSKAAEEMAVTGSTPVLLVHPDVRLVVRRILETSLPSIFVVSYNELSQGVQVKSIGMVE
jgi:flagellar biosynthesis protein FlhA